MITIKKYAEEKGLSDRTARKQLEKMVATGELVREKGVNKVYVFYTPKQDSVRWHDPFNKALKAKPFALEVPKPVKKKVWKNPRKYQSKNRWPMTEKQLLILQLYKSGLTTSEVAEQVQVTVNTLHKHMDRIYYKLDVHSRQEAIDKALGEDCKLKTEDCKLKEKNS
jgi:DNA-binding CsgD family transcriptional regulator